MDDPDAPASTWFHWLMWNIDPRTSEIKENSIPSGSTQGKTSFDSVGYGGPYPPLTLAPSSTKQDLEKAFAGHILDKTELISLYSRK